MHNHQPENYVCPLCQIVKGEPTAKGPSEEAVILRTNLVTVFIAGKWWASNTGHVIIVPNQHVENIYELPDETGHAIFDMSKKVALALKKVYECDGVSTLQHNEPAGNQEVWHYHFHVVPRYTGDNFYGHIETTYWPTMIQKSLLADELRKVLCPKPQGSDNTAAVMQFQRRSTS